MTGLQRMHGNSGVRTRQGIVALIGRVHVSAGVGWGRKLLRLSNVAALVLIVNLSSALRAQPQSPAREADAMQPLDWLVGQWEGESWIEFVPGQRRTSHSVETVQSKVGGAVLLIEGYHKADRRGDDGKEQGTVTHDAISMLFYDARAKRYRFVAYTARQGFGDFEAKVTGRGWEWEMTTPVQKIRYTITRTDRDEWSEIGESSRDGNTWRQMFGMTLHRRSGTGAEPSNRGTPRP